MEALLTYKHQLLIQIRFKDIDKQGHVNNAVHLTYFEIARSDFFTKALTQRNDWQETGIILASTKIDYNKPILFEDELYCLTKVSRFGETSFDVEHILIVKSNSKDVVVATGKSTLVCFNYKNNHTFKIPDDWKSSINLYQNEL